MGLPRAEDVNYWKSGRKNPGKYVDQSVELIRDAGGTVIGHAWGRSHNMECQAVMLEFEFEGRRYREVWPVLPHDEGDETAARRQAATFMKHAVKAKCMSAKVLGFGRAFFSNLLLPDGRISRELSGTQIREIPVEVFGQQQLPNGEEDERHE